MVRPTQGRRLTASTCTTDVQYIYSVSFEHFIWDRPLPERLDGRDEHVSGARGVDICVNLDEGLVLGPPKSSTCVFLRLICATRSFRSLARPQRSRPFVALIRSLLPNSFLKLDLFNYS